MRAVCAANAIRAKAVSNGAAGDASEKYENCSLTLGPCGRPGVNNNGEIVGWGLHGNVTRVIPGAETVEAVNARGVIAGLHADGARRSWAIWTGGRPQDVDGYVAGITDSGVAYGQRGWGAVVYRCG